MNQALFFIELTLRSDRSKGDCLTLSNTHAPIHLSKGIRNKILQEQKINSHLCSFLTINQGFNMTCDSAELIINTNDK